MNNTEKVSNGYDDTSTGDEQIRSMVSFQFQEIVDETNTGILDWNRRKDQRGGGQMTRMTC